MLLMLLWLLENSYGKYFQIHSSLVIQIQGFFSVKQKNNCFFFLHNAIPFTQSLEDLQLLQIIFPLFVNICETCVFSLRPPGEVCGRFVVEING
jgi:hypothetical protein